MLLEIGVANILARNGYFADQGVRVVITSASPEEARKILREWGAREEEFWIDECEFGTRIHLL